MARGPRAEASIQTIPHSLHFPSNVCHLLSMWVSVHVALACGRRVSHMHPIPMLFVSKLSATCNRMRILRPFTSIWYHQTHYLCTQMNEESGPALPTGGLRLADSSRVMGRTDHGSPPTFPPSANPVYVHKRSAASPLVVRCSVMGIVPSEYEYTWHARTRRPHRVTVTVISLD
eukprot:scaffold149714_cov37-Tisochrysis_lutea.AAC.2